MKCKRYIKNAHSGKLTTLSIINIPDIEYLYLSLVIFSEIVCDI